MGHFDHTEETLFEAAGVHLSILIQGRCDKLKTDSKETSNLIGKEGATIPSHFLLQV